MRAKDAVLFVILLGIAAVALAGHAGAQSQPQLGNITGAVVTLYYYDAANQTKGAMVDIPENPQLVQWDYTKAAPGTYVFYHVPQGTYYVEAVHNNHTWFAVTTVTEGTATANVAIPPFRDAGAANPSATAVLTPAPSASPAPTAPPATPSPSPARASPTPGLTTLCAITGLTVVALYIIYKKE